MTDNLPDVSDEDFAQAIDDLAEALVYPIDRSGYRYVLHWIIPIVSYHLARVGFRLDKSKTLIKSRRVPPNTPGAFEDANEWVPVNEPDTIEDELAGATLDDIPHLSPAARAVIMQRAGGDGSAITTAQPDPNTDLDALVPWHVETSIRFDDEDNTHG